jgi:hypothetical protein
MLTLEISLTNWSNLMLADKMISTGKHNSRVSMMQVKLILYSESLMLASTTGMNTLETDQDLLSPLSLTEFM